MDWMPIFEPNAGAASTSRSNIGPSMEEASSMLPNFEDSQVQSKIVIILLKIYNQKVKDGEAKKIATFVAPGGIACASSFKREDYKT